MIVEGRGIGFWTRVRFPPGPLVQVAANPLQGNYYCVYKNVFAVIVDFDVLEKSFDDKSNAITTHSDIL